MRKILFKNEFFKSEKTSEGAYIVTVLKDNRNFHGINLEGCRFTTTAEGFIDYELTESVEKALDDKCRTSEEKSSLREELRNRTLNILISYL